MFSIALQIHRNILSIQCYIRYVDDSNCVDTIQVDCFSSELQLSLLKNDATVKKVKIITENDFFIPAALYSDFDSTVKAGSTIVCRTTQTPTGKSVAECSFRLQVSQVDNFDQSESELKVEVKDFFKERFKDSGYWKLFCVSCGAALPLDPVIIENVQEYSESELSEGWFCHGNGPQPALQPSSRTLYMDDTSFYLYPRTNFDISHKVTTVLNKKGCSIHDAGCQKEGCINVPSSDCSEITHSDSSDSNCSIKSADCSGIENIDQSVSRGLHFLDSSATNFTHGQNPNDLPTLAFLCAAARKQVNLDAQVFEDSATPNNNSSCLKQAKSSLESSTHQSYGDDKHSDGVENEYLNDSKVLNIVECQSCGNVLTSEKSSFPFTRFYLNKLMFKKPSSDDDDFDYSHKITLQSFWSLVTRSQTSLLPSKLFLQSKVRGEELCLLLWIPSAPLDHFLLQNSLEDIPLEINLKTEPVYKVLYFIGTSRSENVRSWRHDFGVDFYDVSDTMVKTLTGILESSSSCLPKASSAGGFSCGFLSAPSQWLLRYNKLENVTCQFLNGDLL